jgi:hypothetical protein
VVLKRLGQRSDLGPAWRAFHSDSPTASVSISDECASIYVLSDKSRHIGVGDSYYGVSLVT